MFTEGKEKVLTPPITYKISGKAYQEQLRYIYCTCEDYKDPADLERGEKTRTKVLVQDLDTTRTYHGNTKNYTMVHITCEKVHISRSDSVQSCAECGIWYYGKPDSLACGKGYNNCIANYEA